MRFLRDLYGLQPGDNNDNLPLGLVLTIPVGHLPDRTAPVFLELLGDLPGDGAHTFRPEHFGELVQSLYEAVWGFIEDHCPDFG